MAVLFITRLVDDYCRTAFDQEDGARSPWLKAQSFSTKARFDLRETQWSEFVVPWKSSGDLKVHTHRDHACYVEYYAGTEKGDHVIVVYKDGEKDVIERTYVGPQGRDHYTCTLQVAADGSIKFADIQRGFFDEADAAPSDAEALATA